MNPDHLKIFMQGVEAWNAWRQKDRDLNPALRVGREASLSRPWEYSRQDDFGFRIGATVQAGEPMIVQGDEGR